jgi:hypothetical protein
MDLITARKPARLVTAAVAISCSAWAFGCLNDRDSLYRESYGSRDVLKVVVGWFPVHTPLYYRIRIRRDLPLIAKDPRQLSLYDDVAVAYDKLGDDARAIQVIERKRAEMEKLAMKPKLLEPDFTFNPQDIEKSSEDPWYRDFANCGTFWVHRWFHEGMPAARKKEWLDRGQALIDRAVQINPEAHGAREFAQQDVIRWLRKGKPKQTLADFLHYKDGRQLNALAGLIELGGAWESVDVYHAIASKYGGNFGYFIWLRVLELEKAGKHSQTGQTLSYWHHKPADSGRVESDYHLLREAAERYRTGYQDYEATELAKGKHPDSDPDFWSGYVQPEFPHFGVSFMGWLEVNEFLLVMVIAMLVPTIYYLVLRRKAHRSLYQTRSS